MTDTMFTRTALTEAAEKAGVTTDQARTILEAAGVTVQPEKPALPTEPGSFIIATEVRGVRGEWRMFRGAGGYWFSAGPIGTCYHHRPDHITAWTPARVVPAAAPATLTEDQVGDEWSKESALPGEWSVLGSRSRERITATVNAILAQHAAPAEGEPIDLDAVVREGNNQVRLLLSNGDEVAITVTCVEKPRIESPPNLSRRRDVRAGYLLHREEA